MVLAAVLFDGEGPHDGAELRAGEEVPSAREAVEEARAEGVAAAGRYQGG